MKKQLQPLLPTLREETRFARETFAKQAFELELIRANIHKAAALGLSARRLRLPNTLSGMNATEAAKALDKWCKAEGLTITWENREVDLPEGPRLKITEPEISW